MGREGGRRGGREGGYGDTNSGISCNCINHILEESNSFTMPGSRQLTSQMESNSYTMLNFVLCSEMLKGQYHSYTESPSTTTTMSYTIMHSP